MNKYEILLLALFALTVTRKIVDAIRFTYNENLRLNILYHFHIKEY